MTIEKKVKTRSGSKIQVFAHHGTSSDLPDAMTMAAGDIIDVVSSLGTIANRCQIIMRGSMDLTIRFNDLQPITTYNPSGADTTQYVAEGDVSNLRLLNTSGTQVFEFNNLGIRTITIVNAGSPSTSNFFEILVAAA